MNEKFSLKAKESIYKSTLFAQNIGASNLNTEHLIWGIFEVNDTELVEILTSLEIDYQQLKQKIAEYLDLPLLNSVVSNVGYLPLSYSVEKIFKFTDLLMRKISVDIISTAGLLYCALRSDEPICRLIKAYGVNLDNLLDRIKQNTNSIFLSENQEEFQKNHTQKEPSLHNKILKNKKNSILKTFGKNLTKLAKEGAIDPVVGREKEIERILQILSRRKKNNPIIVGESGVGKSVLVEGLALQIVNNQVPDNLKDKEIYSIEMSTLVAGAIYRGEFEERMNNLIEEVSEHKNIILFFDEIHTLIGAGNSSNGGLDAANILKPALAQGEFQCIGTTTLDEFRQFIERDMALERRFQKIQIEPTSFLQTIEILNEIKEKYEQHHKVKYTDKAIEACVVLTERYIPQRMLPDKAIDALDEAGARVFMNNKSLIINDEINFKEINEQDIAQVVSSISGIPIEQITQEEKLKLLKLEEILGQKIIGQNQAIEKISKSIKRNRVGLKDFNKPIGSFFFLGTTGVGKTQLAKILAQEIFNSKEAIIRIDMSEYSEKFSISRLIGAPPGYVGYEQGGQLTEKVRRKPYSVILLDEIEKAHTDIFNLLLQVLDEGFLTDSLGRKIDFKNTILIMTSNVGVKQAKDFEQSIGFQTMAKYEQQQSYIQSIIEKNLKRSFSPEFLNRIDEIVFFNQLTRENIKQIIEIELNKFYNKILKLGYNITITDGVKDFLVEKSYDKQYGARPLKRAIQTYIEDQIAEQILSNKIKQQDKVKIDYQKENQEILFSKY